MKYKKSGTKKAPIQSLAHNQALNHLEGNLEENIPKLVAMVDKSTPKGWYVRRRGAVRKATEELKFQQDIAKIERSPL